MAVWGWLLTDFKHDCKFRAWAEYQRVASLPGHGYHYWQSFEISFQPSNPVQPSGLRVDTVLIHRDLLSHTNSTRPFLCLRLP